MKITGAIPEYEIVAPKEAVIAWKHDRVTQQIIQIVSQEIEGSADRMGAGETLGEDIIQATARVVGYIEGLKFLENIMEAINFVEDKEDANERSNKKTKEDS